MAKLKEVLVVEGKDDTKRIEQAVDADTFETNGSAINKEMISQIKHLQETRGVIVMTDPDFNGERIRRIITDAVPDVKHAFITKKQGVPTNAGGSLGVEHADINVIRTALEHLSVGASDFKPVITQGNLLAAGLIGQADSRHRREQLGEQLNLGYVNGKQLLKRLQLFQISHADFSTAVEKINKENE